MMAWKRKKFTKENTYKGSVPNKPGQYKFYNSRGELIYTGHASRLRHRIQSYRQVDCFQEHPTKKILRGRINTFAYKVMPVAKARKIEKKVKAKARFNFN